MTRDYSTHRPMASRRRRVLASAVAAVALAGLVGTAIGAAAQNRPAANAPGNARTAGAQGNGNAQPNIPHAGMLRFPDISQDSIVFSYANDLWIVPKEGGIARPLASPPGMESFPKFSPDGSKVAFSGNYEGDRDIYVVDAWGGQAERITYHPARENLNGWVDNNTIHFSAGGMSHLPVARQTQQLFTQTLDASGPTGALPEQLPIPWGASADISADGKWMAYIPHSTDFRTWKRYRGGMATDVWLFNLEDKSATQITDWEGTDTAPMVHNGKAYYLSDNTESHRLNLFEYDPQTKRARQLTSFSDYDVRFPSMGPGNDGEGEIVFQQGSKLFTLSLGNGSEPREVQVIIPGAKPTVRPRLVDTEDFLGGGDLGPSGKQVAFEARGDIWVLPAATGHPIHLTNSDASAERGPSWSPDGKWIAYSSDADGEYNIYLKKADDTAGEAHRLTELKGRFWNGFEWAPDSKKFIAQDQTGRKTLLTITEEDGKVTAESKELDRDPAAGSTSISWSHDSNWITYSRADEAAYTTAVYIIDVRSGEKHKVTSDMFAAASPTFDRKGEWLYYVTSMDFSSPDYSNADTTFVYRNLDRIVAVPLRNDVKNPMRRDLDKEKGASSDEPTTRPSGDRPGGGEERPADGPRRRGRPGSEVASDIPLVSDIPLLGMLFSSAQDQPTTKPATQASDDDKPVAEQFKLDSPIHGEWAGQLKGLKAVGAPDDEADLSFTVFAHADGSFTGSSEAMGQKRDFDSITFDADSGQFTATRSQGPMSTTLSGKVEGEKIEGTWEAKVNGAAMGSGTWSASKTGPISAEKLAAAAGASKGAKSTEPLKIDFEGFEARGIMLPIRRGNFSSLSVNDRNQLIYVRQGEGGFGGGGPPQQGQQGEGGPGVKLVDITDEEIQEGNVIGGVMGYDMSADGKKLLVAQMGGGGQGGPPGAGRGGPGGGRRVGVINAAKGQQLSKMVPLTGLTKRVEPKEEWKQIVRDAWRRQRDFFYVENMHGVEWETTLEHYLPMVDDAVSREDVSYIISEMISELNIGHAYYSGGDPGDVPSEPNRNVGLLGADWELAGEGDARGYRIKKVYSGGPWDVDARGPLSQPGVDIKQGDFILAVNGQKLDPKTSPFAAFIGLSGRPTTLLVSDKPTFDAENKKQREVVVTPIGSEGELRYRDWIAHNVKVVDEASDGKIGYIYVPNTGTEGQNDLFRQFYGQAHKDALIIDERWNGGGQIPTRFIELLNRPPTNMWALRYGKDWQWPPDAHWGPKAMLINGLAGSGGDMFPWLFRHNNLGKLIGTRTWGGLVGISGVPGLVDGGRVTVPNFGFYEMDGTWGVEGHGVDPDIEVIADPSKMQDGHDIQLQAAIDHLIEEIKRNPPPKAKRPADPDRKGMGIPETDY